MIVKIPFPSLPKEYRKKLIERKLTKDTLQQLAISISKIYVLQKRRLKIIAIAGPALTIIMVLLSLLSPAASHINQTVYFLCCAVAILFEIILLIIIHYVWISRIPRQFSNALKKGYPELTAVYGYSAIIDGTLANFDASQQFPFSLYIEEVFQVKNSADIIVTGFAHGLIKKNCSVFITGEAALSQKTKAALITGIEISSGKSSLTACDCMAALLVRNGKSFNLKPGMWLYRKEPCDYY